MVGALNNRTMKRYLVIADTYAFGYGVMYHLFAICNSKEEAIKFVMDNPVQQIGENSYDFFRHYEKDKVRGIYEHIGETTKSGVPKKTRVGERILSKEEYIADRYITEFNGNPVCIGSYIE
jgi:hypothetical protein